MYILIFMLVLTYHFTAGWIYLSYITEKEVHKRNNKPDIMELMKFFNSYRMVIITLWPFLFGYGIYKQVFRIMKT